MANTATSRTYSKSEFTGTTPSGTPNVDIFRVEVAALSLGVQPFSVFESGTDIVLQWASLPVAADITAVDGAVTSHVGGIISGESMIAITEAETSIDTTTPTTRETLDSGLLVGGTYLVYWYAEIRTTSNDTNAGRANLLVDLNGGGDVERGEITWQFNQYHDFGGSFPQDVEDGGSIVMTLTWNRIGGGSNPVFIQRARLGITRLN